LKKGNILLIGFMGVGKGTVARALVQRSDYFAVDTDDLIESMENLSVKKIFKQYSQRYFRDCETKCALWCEKNITNTIISTGGGFYQQKNIQQIGTIVYLKSDFHRIIEALKLAPNSKKKFKKRPLLQDMKEAQKLYDMRIQEYEKVANITVDVEDWDINRITKEILTKVKTIEELQNIPQAGDKNENNK
jgi:shikimate kinase